MCRKSKRSFPAQKSFKKAVSKDIGLKFGSIPATDIAVQ
jgi:hypothetical protein